MDGALRRVLDLQYKTPDTVPLRRLATVTAVDAVTATVTIEWPGGVEAVGVPHLSSYTPVVGDITAVDLVAGAPLALAAVGLPRQPATSATVVTSQGTTSTTYTDLATAGPAVTVEAAAGQTVKVWIRARAANDTAGTTNSAVASFAVTGAVTIAASDDDALEGTSNTPRTCMSMTLFAVTVSGSHTFTMKYKRINGVTAMFFNRRIIAEVV